VGCSAVLLGTVNHTTCRHSPKVRNFMSTDTITSYSCKSSSCLYVYNLHCWMIQLVFLVGAREFAVFQNVQAGPGARRISCSVGTVGLFPQKSSWGVNWTTLLSSARVKKVWSFLLLLFIYAFILCVHKQLYLYWSGYTVGDF
jgi:hypothetical protein